MKTGKIDHLIGIIVKTEIMKIDKETIKIEIIDHIGIIIDKVDTKIVMVKKHLIEIMAH